MCRTGVLPRVLLNPHDVIQHLCEHNSDEYAAAAAEADSERSASANSAESNTPFGKTTSPNHQPTAAEACTSPPSVSTSPSRFARIRVSPVKTAVPTSTVPAGEPVTVFHSRTLPTLSLFELGCEINRRAKCGEVCLLIALVLMRRYCDAAKVHPTAHMMHRLYITCLHVGMKAHSDEFLNNPTFARVVGIEPRELNVLERELITALDWRVQVTDAQIADLIR